MLDENIHSEFVTPYINELGRELEDIEKVLFIKSAANVVTQTKMHRTLPFRTFNLF